MGKNQGVAGQGTVAHAEDTSKSRGTRPDWTRGTRAGRTGKEGHCQPAAKIQASEAKS